MVWSNSWFSDKGCFNKDEYTSKTVKRTDRKITTYWTQIIWLPCHKQTLFQNSYCIERQEMHKGLSSFEKRLSVSRCYICPSNDHFIKSPKVNSLVSNDRGSSRHSLLTNKFTQWDLKKLIVTRTRLASRQSDSQPVTRILKSLIIASLKLTSI